MSASILPPKKMRLAFRVEGDFWNAYLAPMAGMEGAVFLGSLHMGLASDKQLKRALMQVMRDATAHLFKATGTRVERWNAPVPAPDSERGRA